MRRNLLVAGAATLALALTGCPDDGGGSPDTSADVVSDAPNDVEQDVQPDTEPDVEPDTQPDVGPDTDAVSTPSCAEYCTTIMANCTGADAQYADMAACTSYCETYAAIPLGSADDTSGNTVGCRTYHAGAAAGDPGLHCPHAGPSGGNVCGGWCDTYCQLAQANCTGDDELYADVDTCMTTCAGFAASGDPGATSGDSVQCRIYHLGAAGGALPGGPATHCGHAGPDGGGVCADTQQPSCTEYCTTIMANCTGDDAQYADMAACTDYCTTYGQIPLGSVDDTSGNTVGCRTYHAGAAAGDPGLHCPHAGPSGGNVCGGWCDTYCQLAQANCTGDDELYADVDTCMTTCAGFAASGDPGATSGDSVQCRIYHLGAAGGALPGGPATHCGHAGPDGGGVCVDPQPTCAEYCTTVMNNCTGVNQQYIDMDACTNYCTTYGQIPLGDIGDTSGNTVGCRTYHATAAAGDAGLHCPHAGPTGGNLCGGWCDVYCQLALDNCTGGNELFADESACQTACGAYATDGNTGDTSGDTVQCRIYHLGAAGGALPGGPETHCGHADTDGGGVCVDP